MRTAVSCLVIVLAAYLVGGINLAYLKSKRLGLDIRRIGTGNAGATNAALAFGKKAGLAVALFDIFKAFFSVKICAALFPEVPFSAELAGSACMLGHMLPIQMNFKGGKGLSCLGGIVLAYSPKLFLVLLAAGALLAFIIGYLVVIPITSALAFPLLYLAGGGSPYGFAAYMAAAAVMEFRHAENIRRIRQGTEIRISYLWSKDREMLRLQSKGVSYSGRAPYSGKTDSSSKENRPH